MTEAGAESEEVASPGHKLGQMVGVLLQQILKEPLRKVAVTHNLYCDSQGERPGIRKGKKITWLDKYGTPHDLDYVLERGARPSARGDPVALIEVAWRRYTKHSRAKSGELEGALFPLRQSYPTVKFVGAIIAGEYTSEAQNQLRRLGIEVLVIPFETISSAFEAEGLTIDYPERASAEEKAKLNRTLEALGESQRDKVSDHLWNSIEGDYDKFESRLVAELSRSATRIRITSLYGFDRIYSSINDAIKALESADWQRAEQMDEQGYEVFIDFETGSKVQGRFKTRTELVKFLNQVS